MITIITILIFTIIVFRGILGNSLGFLNLNLFGTVTCINLGLDSGSFTSIYLGLGTLWHRYLHKFGACLSW